MRIARRLGAWPFVDVENNVRGIRRSKSLKRGFYGRRWASTRREWCVDNQRSTRQLHLVEPVSDGEPYSLVIGQAPNLRAILISQKSLSAPGAAGLCR